LRLIEDNQKIIIHDDSSISDALKQIDVNSEGLLFVVDQNMRLIGVLSDGDIRRALIAGKALTDTIANIYNIKPFIVTSDSIDESAIRETMVRERYEVIPVVTASNKLEGYITWDDMLSGKKRIETFAAIDVPVVIMAGGKGTRMAPFTNVLPKPLIPIGDKTILEVIIDQFRKHAVNSYYFTINYRGEMIRAYFEGLDKEYQIEYLKEKDFFGTAGSLKMLPKTITGLFIVTNCDIIVKADYSKILDFHKSSGAALTVISSIQHHTVPYGVIQFSNGGRITEIQEKPEFSFCINTGVYILDSSCLELIPDGEVFHMTHLIDALLAAGKVVSTYPVNESEYIDIGQWDEYRKAVGILGL
jgi:dTDP-glucose pyrophosphorylase/CBS domain-containing protein